MLQPDMYDDISYYCSYYVVYSNTQMEVCMYPAERPEALTFYYSRVRVKHKIKRLGNASHRPGRFQATFRYPRR